ncbi:MAG: flagellar hook-associated protein FlgK [Proteobacteria bacterium]|nr:flagellar hook-associated protein FlgK [Pseudomonadota bacterium]
MSLLGAIGNSLSSMNALQANMQVISGNISNAQNPDFTKKTINLTSDVISGGVVVSGYSRATNDSLTHLLQQSLGDSGLRSTQKDYLQQIQNLLGSSQDSPVLTNAFNDFAAAWRALSAAPEDVTQQQDVLFKAQALAREVNRLSVGLAQITTNLKSATSDAVDELNTSLDNVNRLNQQIVAAQSNGQQATVNNLLDQRDAEVQKISALVNIRIFPRAQNTIGIYTPGGVSLLDTVPNTFTWDGSTITMDPGSSNVTNVLTGGKIEALIGMLDQGSSAATLNDPGKASVYKAQQQLNTLVDLFTNAAGTFAIAYDSAATGAGEQANAFFTGTTANDFALNSNLADGSKTLKQAAASPVATDMDVNTRTITTSGLSISNATYSDYTDAIISRQNQNTKTISDQAKIYQTQADDYQQRLQSSVGVNIDEQMALLTQLQNNYAATAHVISTIQQMFQILEQVI